VDEGRNHEDAAQLRKVVSALEEEISFLRRRLREAPGRAPEVEQELVLEEVPDITYETSAGSTTRSRQIRDAVELPYLHADLFVEHELRAPKGILLYGPPGCGKTLIAKAVANSLAKGRREDRRPRRPQLLPQHQGPELLNKYVGETERQIRLIFQRARRSPRRASPSSCSSTRWSRCSAPGAPASAPTSRPRSSPSCSPRSTASSRLKNVIVIGASNREDMIDPAILRPGRLDVKIKIERPDADAAARSSPSTSTNDLPLARRRGRRARRRPGARRSRR
jgi:proteasome-associated ATPase